MFKYYLCGVDSGHARGFVFKKERSPHCVLLHFKTPFFCIINGRRGEGGAGDCLIQRRGDTVIYGSLSANEKLVNDWIYFEPVEEDIELPFDVILKPDNENEIGKLLESIIKEEKIRDIHSKRRISNLIFEILLILLRASSKCGSPQPSDMQRFTEIRAHILANPGERWTLAKMAATIGYSVSRFCALYTKYFGKSPMDELLEFRLDMAKRLIALEAYRIGDIASMCGFSSIHYFSRFFKSRTGVSPSDYMK